MNVNLASREHNADPHGYYADLRARSPVHPVTLPDGQRAWLVTRYEDAAAVLGDDRFMKDRLNAPKLNKSAKRPWIPPFFRPLTRNMLDVDEPDHARLRALVDQAFTPRLVERMRDRIEALAGGLLDACAGRRRVDLIRAYAEPIPSTIIAEMLGVPATDRQRFTRWSNAIVAASSSRFGVLFAIPGVWRFLRYIRRLVRERRASPGTDDLLGAMVRAEEEGERLSEDELYAMVFLLLVAGHETTVNLIGNGVLALLRHPGELARLRADEGLIASAVEELLRFEGPLEMATERYAREDVAVAGITIPRGELTLVVLASANRDERQFPQPDRLNVAREPNRHLAFGRGPHFCLGASLARLEGQIAIQTLLRRAPGLRLDASPAALRWRRGVTLRGLESLPVVLES